MNFLGNGPQLIVNVRKVNNRSLSLSTTNNDFEVNTTLPNLIYDASSSNYLFILRHSSLRTAACCYIDLTHMANLRPTVINSRLYPHFRLSMDYSNSKTFSSFSIY